MLSQKVRVCLVILVALISSLGFAESLALTKPQDISKAERIVKSLFKNDRLKVNVDYWLDKMEGAGLSLLVKKTFDSDRGNAKISAFLVVDWKTEKEKWTDRYDNIGLITRWYPAVLSPHSQSSIRLERGLPIGDAQGKYHFSNTVLLITLKDDYSTGTPTSTSNDEVFVPYPVPVPPKVK